MAASQENPWASGGTFVSVGGLQRALKVAEATSYNLMKDDGYEKGRRYQQVENCSSFVQIKCLKKIAKLDEQINKVKNICKLTC